jgi:hypothetical protein
MKEFIKYTQSDFFANAYNEFVPEQAQNLLFEMAASCIANGDRIIIELDDDRGSEYIMVDFAPTDNSNSECEYDGQHVCWISSVWHDDEGNYNGSYATYFDAIKEVARILRSTYFSEIYVESY